MDEAAPIRHGGALPRFATHRGIGLPFRRGGYAKERERKLLNDAPVYLQALDHGQTVLTRNSADFDALNQMVPEGRILLYSQSR